MKISGDRGRFFFFDFCDIARPYTAFKQRFGHKFVNYFFISVLIPVNADKIAFFIFSENGKVVGRARIALDIVVFHVTLRSLFSGDMKTTFSDIMAVMYSDAHIHLHDFFLASGESPALSEGQLVCASSHERAEFLWQEEFARAYPAQVFLSFGIHPQDPSPVERPYIEKLIGEGRLDAIGESGFDRFSPAFRSRLDEQKEAWDFQLSIAVDSGLPLVVHCRKSLELVFADTKRLKRLKAVVFHGWEGSSREARSFLDRGVNAWFCAGKGVLRGDRSLEQTVREIPATRLLTETDAPWMKSRTEPFSRPSDIISVASRAAILSNLPVDEFCSGVLDSFRTVFASRRGQE
jgi:TatD DNase family protein